MSVQMILLEFLCQPTEYLYCSFNSDYFVLLETNDTKKELRNGKKTRYECEIILVLRKIFHMICQRKKKN